MALILYYFAVFFLSFTMITKFDKLVTVKLRNKTEIFSYCESNVVMCIFKVLKLLFDYKNTCYLAA